MNEQYAEFIKEELKAEVARRGSINTRAGTAVTGSVGLVTLVLAVFAVLIEKDSFLSGSAKTSSLIALLGAAASAVLPVFMATHVNRLGNIACIARFSFGGTIRWQSTL